MLGLDARTTWIPALKGAIGAVVALILVFIGLHVWSDHQQLHIMIGTLNRMAAAHPDLFK